MSSPPPPTPRSQKFFSGLDNVPIIDAAEPFSVVANKLSAYICGEIDAAYTYEQLRTSVAGHSLKPLITSLSEECTHPAIVAALL
jgi:hypothetical protein